MRLLLRRLGHADTAVHGLRSSFSDWAAEQTAYPSHVIEQALAHTIINAVERAYRRGDLFDKRRRLMDAWLELAISHHTDARGWYPSVTPGRKHVYSSIQLSY
jgi:integrase